MSNDEKNEFSLSSVWGRLPMYDPSLIHNVLRRQQKLMIKGPKKSGKTSLSVQLAIAIAEGKTWIDNQCIQGKVLYINFSLPPSAMLSRIYEVYSALRIDPLNVDNINILNFKGNSVADYYMNFIDHIQTIAIERDYRLILVDSMDYVQGFSNIDISQQINRLMDQLMSQTNTCIVFTTSIDNNLLSNLCDAVIELIPTGEKAISDYRLSIECNTYPRINQQLIKFNYPIMEIIGSSYNDHKMSLANELKKEKSLKELEDAFNLLNIEGDGVDVNKLASHLGIARESLYRKIKKFEGFEISSGVVERINNT